MWWVCAIDCLHLCQVSTSGENLFFSALYFWLFFCHSDCNWMLYSAIVWSIFFFKFSDTFDFCNICKKAEVWRLEFTHTHWGAHDTVRPPSRLESGTSPLSSLLSLDAFYISTLALSVLWLQNSCFNSKWWHVCVTAYYQQKTSVMMASLYTCFSICSLHLSIASCGI